jgi:hypothetical protein
MDRFRWAERHDGLITTNVARKSGRTKRQLAAERASGHTREIRRGVAVVNGTPPTWRQAVRAVLLSCGDHVAASHCTSLVLLGVPPDVAVGEIHVITDLVHRIQLEGVISHRSGVLEEGDVIRRDGMPCTSPLRTVIDLSGSMSAHALGKVVDEMLRKRLLTLSALRERVGRTRPAPGRSVATLRKVLAQRLPGYDPGESELEARIVRIIDAQGLPRPAQQHRVRYGKNRYRIDFAWPDRKLYLEGNGFGWHNLSTDLEGDAHRQNDLVLDGWLPIEITWSMSDVVIADTIRRFIDLSSKRL